MASQELSIQKFDGGMTDDYVNAEPNQFKAADNFLLRPNNKLELRPGTVIHDSTLYRVPSSQVIRSIIPLGTSLKFFQSGRNLYRQNTTWNTLGGPTSNPVFPAGDDTSFPAFSEWNGHAIVTNDAFGNPQKIYQDEDGNIQVRNAGLPKITLTAMIAMANDLIAKYNAHIADASEHTTAADAANTVVISDCYDHASLIDVVALLVTKYSLHEADAALSSGWAYHAAQEASSHALLNSDPDLTTLSDVKIVLDDFKAKFNAHDADGTAHGTDTLHQSSKFSGPTVAGGSTGASQYLYYFCAYYKYTVGSSVFVDRGPTYFVSTPDLTPPNSSTVTISNIPVIANGSTQNFDTVGTYWEIYRTVQNGTTPYYVKSVQNGTTSTTDAASDASISVSTNPILYTSGGVKDNDPAPPAKFVVTVDNVTWYGHVKEGNQVKKQKLRQSIKFDPDSCPEEFELELEDDLVGLGVAQNFPIAVCNNHLYRIEGYKDTQGAGVIEKREIARGIGGINHLSIVNTYLGMFFCGKNGWYYTDGYKVTKLHNELKTTYANLVSTAAKRSRVCGMYDPKEECIYWGMQQSASSSDNDCIFVMDIKASQANLGRSFFTRLEPGNSSWSPCALHFDISNEEIIIGDYNGYVIKFSDEYYNDPKIDTTAAPGFWTTSPIVYNYEGPALNFGEANRRKVATYLTVIADNLTQISLQPNRMNDDSGLYEELAQIRSSGTIDWGDLSGPDWSPTLTGYLWGVFPMLRERRRFPASNQRFLYMQLQLTNASVIILKSDDTTTVTTAVSTGTLKTATYDSGSYTFTIAEEGYYISFEADSYVKEYLITDVTAGVITYQDTLATSPTGAAKKWVIRGVRRSERLNLNSYSIEYEILTPSHSHYRGITDGNA